MAVTTQDPDARSFVPMNPFAWIRMLANNNVLSLVISGAPTNGTSGTGAGVLGKGAQVIDIATGNVYSNFGTLASPVWNLVDSPGSPLVQTAQVQLTNTQVKNCRATPVTIVAAPGAGFFVNPLDCICELVYGGTNAFTAQAGDNLAIKWKDGTTAAIISGGLQAFLQNTASAFNAFVGPALAADINVLKTNVDNQPLVLHNISAAEIAGNAANDNTLVITVTYNIQKSF